MNIYRYDISEFVYEMRVYPFVTDDAVWPEFASDGYIRVLFWHSDPPRIDFNIGFGVMTIPEIEKLQTALDKVAELALRGSHAET